MKISDGSKKKIEEIKVGDKLLRYEVKEVLNAKADGRRLYKQ